ncbi:MAG: sialate O-acetylesterase [Thermoflavifilum sp.]|nr:sialate O-acetylesterase [Thermoflavifilum sp.]
MRKLLSQVCIYFCCISFFSIQAHAQQLRLPDYFSNNMVLQQLDTVTLWGWADATQKIWVKADWLADTIYTTSASNARWQIHLATPKAGGPHELTVSNGQQSITIQNILIGELWLCSGQSNMEMSAAWHYDHWQEEVANANFPEIRLFHVYKTVASCPADELRGRWEICTPATIMNFSAVGYFFGRQLYKQLRIPIGLIESCWGGTPIETWMPDSIFAQHPHLAASAQVFQPVPWCPITPSVTFNAMIAPLHCLPLAGVIWYQGETNTANPQTYTEDFSRMIASWRHLWKKDFPFYFVQIAPYQYQQPYSAALLREAQLRTYQQVPHTGMVVITDITGDTTDIHPKDKKDVGERLARWALALNYHHPEIMYSGPIYDSMKIENHQIRIYFDFAKDGLVIRGNKLTDIYIAGVDRHFLPAESKIEGSTLIVWNRQIPNPVAVRFGFANTAMPNLFKRAGLPASPFRTDDWPVP